MKAQPSQIAEEVAAVLNNLLKIREETDDPETAALLAKF